jgi:hypothetical protein
MCSTGATAEPWETGLLLERFEERLAAELEGPDVAMLAAEVRRQGEELLPSLRARQSSQWDFGGAAGLALGGSLSVPVVDPARQAQLSLALQRQRLARHNEQSSKRRRLEEFVRTLRLLAHLGEVEAILVEHRSGLLAARPDWERLTLDSQAGPLEIGYLEVLRALRQTRSERRLLLELVATRLELEPDALIDARVDRPAIGSAANGTSCDAGSDELIRAGLVLEESLLARKASAAMDDTAITLDLSADARYRSGPTVEPLAADLRLALRVELPPIGPTSADVRVELTAGGVAQLAELSWPARSAEIEVEDPRREHRRSLAEVRLAELRAADAVEAGHELVKLRELVLHAAEDALEQSAEPTMDQLAAWSQARLGLLNAQLERDLALLELSGPCSPELRPSP